MGRLWRLARRAARLCEVAWGALAPRAIEARAARASCRRWCARSRRRAALSCARELRGWELPGGDRGPGERDEDAARARGARGDGARRRGRPARRQLPAQRLPRAPGAWSSSAACVGGSARAEPRDPARRVVRRRARCPTTIFPWFRTPLADALAGHAEPVQRREHQGAAAIAAGARIDLTMRWRGE